MNKQLKLMIGTRSIPVLWEENASAAELLRMASQAPLTIPMEMYGGWEQFGPLGCSIPSSDHRMNTEAGDIMLYCSDQIVVFYGPNTWEYTKLGHMQLTQEELEQILGSGNIVLKLSI